MRTLYCSRLHSDRRDNGNRAKVSLPSPAVGSTAIGFAWGIGSSSAKERECNDRNVGEKGTFE